MAVIIAAGAAFIYAVEFSDWHQLDAVTLDGEPVPDFESRLGLSSGQPTTRQPLALAARRLLRDEATVKVDVHYALPNRLEFETNRFTPVCLALDRVSGRMLGLNRVGRIVPLRSDYDDWEHPVVTGVAMRGIFEFCDDSRVEQLVPQLERLGDDNLELYRLIEELDLSAPTHIAVTVSGLPYRLKTGAETFFEQITGFVRFLEDYKPPVDSAVQFDLRFADMIIQENESE